MPEVARDQAHMKDAVAYLKSQSLTSILQRKCIGMCYLFYPFLPVYDLWYMLLLPFCIFGIINALKHGIISQWLLLTMFIYVPTGIVFNISTRYRHSMMPAFIIMAALGFSALHTRFHNRQWYRYIMGGWIVINLCILLWAPSIRTLLKSLLL